MSATIRDVARLAGVNPSTVSRVINENSAMAQLDYHPNSLARSLVSGLAGAIGMVLDTGDDGAFNNAFFGSSQYAIEQVAQAQGITEHMKAADQLAWVGAMNNTRNAAREVVLHNLVFQ